MMPEALKMYFHFKFSTKYEINAIDKRKEKNNTGSMYIYNKGHKKKNTIYLRHIRLEHREKSFNRITNRPQMYLFMHE